MLWGICCYFNPAGFQSKKQNYDVFREHLTIPLITVELAYHDAFELSSTDADRLIQISSKDVLWQKERLLNIALEALPPECTAVAWLDADIVFDNRDWPAETMEALKHHTIIQPFQTLLELESHQHLNERDQLTPQFKSYTWAYNTEEIPEEFYLIAKSENGMSQKLKLATGKAWAGRRSVLDKVGFYDVMIVGGGDRLILNAMVDKMIYDLLSLEHAEHYKAWAKTFFSLVQGKLGYVTGNITHLWHGDLKKRLYQQRKYDFAHFDFDPFIDIQLNANQAWKWASDKPDLHAYVRNYFQGRQEDGI